MQTSAHTPSDAQQLPVEPVSAVLVNEAQMIQAFELWELRFRDAPDGFLTADEVARLTVADASTNRAIYFGALLREVRATAQAGAAQPDCHNEPSSEGGE